MKKSIIIIGAGMGGLSAGCYGQMNGYNTQIFEMHTLPGGQCASWKRKGYSFDACIHHLFGCSPSSKIYQLWNELGAMPRDLVQPSECTSVLSTDGKRSNALQEGWEETLGEERINSS
jgi:phytoene dehydrogenase-like protein